MSADAPFMRLRRALVLVWTATVLFACLIAAGCGGQGSSVSLPVLDNLDTVADATGDAQSARFEMHLQLEMPETLGFESGLGFSVSGAYDNAAETARMTMDLGSFADLMGGLAGSLGGKAPAELSDPEKWKLEMVLDGTVAYMRMPFLASQLPAGKEWVEVDLERAAGMQGLELDEFRSFANDGDPRAALEYLRSIAGPVTHVGTEEIRGVPTSHYFVVVDWKKALEQAAKQANQPGLLDQLQGFGGAVQNIPVDVWVDENNLVRRMEMEVTASNAGQKAGASVTMELFDYGEPVQVTAPPAADVVDAFSLGG